MAPELIVVNTEEGLQTLKEYLVDKEYIAYDCETTGLTKKDAIVGFSICAEENKAFYVIVRYWNRDTKVLEYNTNALQLIELIRGLRTKKLIMHNATFDCMMAEAYFKVSLIDSVHTDTMILAHLLNENRRVGLKELGASMYGEDSTTEAKEMQASVLGNGGTWTAKDKEMYKADSYILGRYGAKDAWLTYKLLLDLVPELYEQGLDKFFYEEESMPLLRGPTYELNTVGLQVDSQRLVTLRKTLEAECLEAKDFIYSEINKYVTEKYPGTNKKNCFNIGASQQLSWLLFGQLELEFNTLTESGKKVCKSMGLKLPYTRSAKRQFIMACQQAKDKAYEAEAKVNGKVVKAKKVKEPWTYIACDKAALKKLEHKYKWIERLLQYQKNMKLLSTYVEGIESRVSYGVIQPGFLQHGTTSGRYSSRSPNFQNLPRDEKRIKECIVSRPGKVFVGADYSQLEPRVFAFTSNDEKLLNSFKTGDDFYSITGIEVNDKFECVPRKEGHPKAFGVMYPKLRQDAKVFTLASTYGATGYQLAPLMGKSSDEAQADIDRYFEKFPLVKQMMMDSHEMAKTNGQVLNLFGRPRRMPEARRISKLYGNVSHSELPYEARNLLNLAVNHRIQSTAASIVNRAAIKFYNDYKELGLVVKLVLQVHDSLVAECNEADAENVALLLQNAMETAVDLKTIQLEAVPKIGLNLAKV